MIVIFEISYGSCLKLGSATLLCRADLSALTALKVEGLPNHLAPWEAGGFKAWSVDKKT